MHVFGHPRNGTRPDTYSHLRKGLHFDIVTTEVSRDYLETCCLILVVFFVDLQ